jgi:hypothetical protein
LARQHGSSHGLAEALHSAPRIQVPQQRESVAAGAGQGLPVRAERDFADDVGMVVQLRDQGAGADIEDPDQIVAAADGEGLAVRAECGRDGQQVELAAATASR